MRWSTDKSLIVHYLLSFYYGAVAQLFDSVLSPASGAVTLHVLESWEFRAVDTHVLVGHCFGGFDALCSGPCGHWSFLALYELSVFSPALRRQVS
jgi:hypothetical protein